MTESYLLMHFFTNSNSRKYPTFNLITFKKLAIKATVELGANYKILDRTYFKKKKFPEVLANDCHWTISCGVSKNFIRHAKKLY